MLDGFRTKQTVGIILSRRIIYNVIRRTHFPSKPAGDRRENHPMASWMMLDSPPHRFAECARNGDEIGGPALKPATFAPPTTKDAAPCCDCGLGCGRRGISHRFSSTGCTARRP